MGGGFAVGGKDGSQAAHSPQVSRYIIAGVEAVERVWVERGFAESIDEVVAIVQRAHERQVPME